MKAIFFSLLLISFPLYSVDDFPEMNFEIKEAPADKENKCANPHAAITKALSGGNERSLCFEKGRYSAHEIIVIAEHLASVLKDYDVKIDLKQIPHDADYLDPDTAQFRFTLLNVDRPIYVERINNKWLFTDDVIDNINSLYNESLAFNVRRYYSYLPSWVIEDFFGIANLNIFQIILFISLLILAFVIRYCIATLITWKLAQVFSRLAFDEHQLVILKKTAFAFGSFIVIALLSVLIPSLDINVHITHYIILVLRFLTGVALVLIVFHSVDILIVFLYRRALRTSGKMDDQLVPLLGKALKIIIVILGTIFILQNLDVDVTSLLAGITIGGLAFSFAAKDAVANLFGSVTIFSDKSFAVGDNIKIYDYRGTVESIGFRSTRIRTEYDTLISMPNSKFTDEVVENFSKRRKKKTSADLHVDHHITAEQIEALCNGIRAIIKAHPLTRKDSYEVHLTGFLETALNIMMSFYSNAKSWGEELRMRHEIFLDIWRLAEQMQVKFAFITHDAHVYMSDTKKPKTIPSVEELATTAASFAPLGSKVIPPGPRGGEPYFAETKTYKKGPANI